MLQLRYFVVDKTGAVLRSDNFAGCKIVVLCQLQHSRFLLLMFYAIESSQWLITLNCVVNLLALLVFSSSLFLRSQTCCFGDFQFDSIAHRIILFSLLAMLRALSFILLLCDSDSSLLT